MYKVTLKNREAIADKMSNAIGKSLSTVDAKVNKDGLSQVTKGLYKGRLKDIYDFDTIYKAYPELEDMPVRMLDLAERYGGADKVPKSIDDAPFYDPTSKTIFLFSKDHIDKDILQHEMQHAIQHIEGWPSVGSAEAKEAREKTLKQLVKRFERRAKKTKTKELRDKFNAISRFYQKRLDESVKGGKRREDIEYVSARNERQSRVAELSVPQEAYRRYPMMSRDMDYYKEHVAMRNRIPLYDPKDKKKKIGETDMANWLAMGLRKKGAKF
jgi:hypothetical protein